MDFIRKLWGKSAGRKEIIAGRDVAFGDVSGQVAIGEYINQFKIDQPSGESLIKLIEYLDKKRQINADILNSYSPSEIPDYPHSLRDFVIKNRVEEITSALGYLQDHRILLISGISGVGKTTLARALIETRPANVPLPFWFDFSKKTDATLGDVLERLAGYMNAPRIAGFKTDKREAGQDDITKLTGELQRREQVWLVFDNLETILKEDTKFHDDGIDMLFTSLRGSTHNAKIIVTSRTLPLLNNSESLIDILDEKWEIKGLKLNFAIDFLVKNGFKGVEHERLKELAKGLDGHPLALRLLIELVKKFGVSDTLKDLSMFQKRKKDTIKTARKLFKKLAGDEKELLEHISVFRRPESITAIKTMFTEKTAEDAVEKLMNKSLLETDHKGSYWLHPLIQEFSYDDLRNKIDIHKLALQYYLSLHLPAKCTRKEDVQPLIEAHHHACVAHKYDIAAKILIFYDLGNNLSKWGNYRILVELYSGMLPKNPFKDKPFLSKTLHLLIIGMLGNVYHHLGETQKAIEYYQSVLNYAQKSGAKHSESHWLGDLGNAYYSLGKTKTAFEYFERALKIAQKVGDRKSEGLYLGSIGNIHRFQGNDEEASTYYEKALTIAKEVGDRRNEAQWLGNLGIIYRNFNEINKSIYYNNQALKISQEINNKLQEGEFIGNLGSAYFALGNMRKALECYEKSLKIATEIEYKENICVLLGNMGNLYLRIGEIEKCIEYFEKALKIARKIGDKQVECQVLENMGSAYCVIGNEKKSNECFEKGSEIAKEIEDKQSQIRQREKLSLANFIRS